MGHVYVLDDDDDELAVEVAAGAAAAEPPDPPLQLLHASATAKTALNCFIAPVIQYGSWPNLGAGQAMNLTAAAVAGST